MFQQLGLALISFFVAYLCFIGVFNFLENNYGVEVSMGEQLFLSEDRGEEWVALKSIDKADKKVLPDRLGGLPVLRRIEKDNDKAEVQPWPSRLCRLHSKPRLSFGESQEYSLFAL